MRLLLNKYNSGIEFYRESYIGLENYYFSKKLDDFNNYLNSAKKADNVIDPARVTASDKYFEYYDLIQNF